MAGPQLALRLVFPKPGFFLADGTVELLVDRSAVYSGSFLAGIDVSVPVEPGRHEIVARIALGPVSRSKAYSIEVGPHRLTVATLRYSRFWGNFASRLHLASVA